jgi:phage N-6-adenine-methyltransferase
MARQVAADCEDPLILKEARDQTKHIAEWYHERGAKLEAQNQIAEGRLRLERKLGAVCRDMEKNVGGRPPKVETDDLVASVSTLGDVGITGRQSSIWQKVAKLQQKLFDDRVAEAQENGLELTTTYVLRGKEPGQPINWASESVEWYTPKEYIEAARSALGAIDLDPASNKHANKTVRAAKFFAREDNGLEQPWPGRVWLNPPYGEEGTDRWVIKLIEEYTAGRTAAAILLVNAVTDRKWFAPLFEQAICFTDHRIEFYTPEGEPQSPVSGNAFVYFGSERKAFKEHFTKFGAVVVRL